MNVSMRRLRVNLASILRQCEAGKTFLVTRRGVPVARVTGVHREFQSRPSVDEPLNLSTWPKKKTDMGWLIKVPGWGYIGALNLVQAGQYLGVSVLQVRRWGRTGKLTVIRGWVTAEELLRFSGKLP